MSNWLPSLNALRAFEAVSRHLSYRQVADELRVTPAAVTQLVAKLEDTLGAPLLERRGGGLALTVAGASGSEELSRAFREIASAVKSMRPTDRRQRLIISVEPSFAAAWLVPRLEEFRVRNPGVDVLIDSSSQVVDLARGVADVAVRFGETPRGSLVVHRLFDEQLCAFCSPLLAQGSPGVRRLEDLTNVCLLHWDLSDLAWASATRKWMGWKQWLSHIGASHIAPGEGLTFSDYNLAVQAAIAGQGVVLGSLPILRSLVAANLLVTPLPERVVTDIGYDLVTTETARARADVRCFSDWIIEQARSE
jgi:LysR family glycine cleavage system transcriptional activator